MIKPLLEKFLSCNEVEVLRIYDNDFSLRKITTLQAGYLNNYYEYFMDNPLEFIPFINAIVIDADKERLKKFLTNFDKEQRYDIGRIRSMIHAICIQSLNLRPISLDYALSFTIKDTIEAPSIINRFISQLIYYGYKKSEIDEFSNNKIIRLCIEEMYLRDKTQCLIFLANFINSIDSKLFPLSYNVLELVKERAESLVFRTPQEKQAFLKEFYEALGTAQKPSNNNTQVKTKSMEDIRNEIKQKRSRVSDLPK